MLRESDVAAIEQIVGYTFRNKALLAACFTHVSYANAHRTASNERLEFLGDAVLGFLAAKHLFADGKESEALMTKKRQKLVSERPLRESIERAGLDKYLRAEGAAGGKAVSSLFEAIVAGVYLDGGMEEAERFVGRLLGFSAEEGAGNDKGELQEYLQARDMQKPEYILTGREGPDHAPRFTVRAEGAGFAASGEGSSKAKAEKAAARALLLQLKNRSGDL